MKLDGVNVEPTEDGFRVPPRRAVIEGIIDACHEAISASPAASDSTGEEMTCAVLTMVLRICTSAVRLGADRAKLRQAIGMVAMVAADDTAH